MENEVIVLKAREFCEAYDVTFVRHGYNGYTGPDYVEALNEGGYNGVQIDAYQLYLDLKEIYG